MEENVPVNNLSVVAVQQNVPKILLGILQPVLLMHTVKVISAFATHVHMDLGRSRWDMLVQPIIIAEATDALRWLLAALGLVLRQNGGLRWICTVINTSGGDSQVIGSKLNFTILTI